MKRGAAVKRGISTTMVAPMLQQPARIQWEKKRWNAARAAGAQGMVPPGAWSALGGEWHRRFSRSTAREANDWLRTYKDNLTRGDLYLPCGDGELQSWCDVRVTECKGIVHSGDATARRVRLLLSVLRRYGMELPRWLMELAEGHLQPLPGVEPGDIWPLFARLTCKRWWRRQARKLTVRAVEAYMRKRGTVAKYRQAYCSDWAVKNRLAASERNRLAMEQATATNQDGDSYTVAELAGTGQANMVNRRNELMTRIRGFEEVAADLGHVGEFWTFTTPSFFHRMRWVKAQKRAEKISKWNESTPREAQAYLCNCWERVRASMLRQGIRCYGFRVVEPHHDGTPHWHLLLFFHPDDVLAARKIARRYLLRVAGHEPGAIGARFNAKAIDPAKGTASGYIAKYIAKNIDGAGVHGHLKLQDDDSGLDLGSAALRVRSWASVWGVRQFQQIGGASVTVWRELRRVWAHGEPGKQADLFGSDVAEACGEAANAGDWAAYTMAMGGALLPRADRPLKPAYWLEEGLDEETGEILPCYTKTEYGDDRKGSVFGVDIVGCGFLLTKVYRWVIDWRPQPRASEPRGGEPPGGGFSILAHLCALGLV